MWVNVVDFYDGCSFKLNLGSAATVSESENNFRIDFAGESGKYVVDKTPEMVEAYNSLVPEKSQPVVPAEPDQYEWVTQDVQPVRPGIDLYRYVMPNGEVMNGGWNLAVVGDVWDSHCVHGWTDSDGNTLELRCRRFQLPSKQEVQP